MAFLNIPYGEDAVRRAMRGQTPPFLPGTRPPALEPPVQGPPPLEPPVSPEAARYKELIAQGAPQEPKHGKLRTVLESIGRVYGVNEDITDPGYVRERDRYYGNLAGAKESATIAEKEARLAADLELRRKQGASADATATWRTAQANDRAKSLGQNGYYDREGVFHPAPPRLDPPVIVPQGGTAIDRSGNVIATGAPKPATPQRPMIVSPGATVLDPATGRPIYTAPNRPAAGGSVALPPAPALGNAREYNDEYLKQLDQATANQVKAIVDGRFPVPTGAALRSPQIMRLLEAASVYEPGFDLTQWKVRADTRTDFAKGKAAVNVRSLNTLVDHAGKLMEATEQLGNRGIPAWNTVANTVKSKAIGNPALVKWNVASQAVISEAVSLFKGTGATNQEIDELRQHFNPNGTQEEQKRGVQTIIELAFGRLRALDEQFANAFKKPRDFRFLSDKSIQILRDKIGVDPAELGEVTNASPQGGGTSGAGEQQPQNENRREQVSPSTGQYRHSLDGGKTWQPGRLPQQ